MKSNVGSFNNYVSLNKKEWKPVTTFTVSMEELAKTPMKNHLHVFARRSLQENTVRHVSDNTEFNNCFLE